MKKKTVLIYVLAAALGAVPAFGSAKREARIFGNPPISSNQAVESLPERIAKLKTVISKGENLYSAAELRQLQHELKDGINMLKTLEKPGK